MLVHAGVLFAHHSVDFLFDRLSVFAVVIDDDQVAKHHKSKSRLDVNDTGNLGNNVNKLVRNPFEATPEVSITTINITVEVSDNLFNWGNIEVQVYWSVHDFLEDSAKHVF